MYDHLIALQLAKVNYLGALQIQCTAIILLTVNKSCCSVHVIPVGVSLSASYIILIGCALYHPP